MMQSLVRRGSTAAVFGALVTASAVNAGCGMPMVKVSEDRVATAPLGAEQIVFRNEVGDVTLVASDEVSEITAAVHVVGKGTSTEKAQEVLDNLEIVLRYDKKDPAKLLAMVELPKKYKRSPYSASVDWEIVLPSGVALDIGIDVGDISASGFVNGASVSSDVGDIDLLDLRGGASVSCDVGDIRVGSDGDVVVRNDVGDITILLLSGQMGDVVASSDVGDVTIEFPADRVGHVHVSTDVGSVSKSFEGMNATIHKHKGGTLVADLGGKSEPKIEVNSDVGSIGVHARGSGGE